MELRAELFSALLGTLTKPTTPRGECPLIERSLPQHPASVSVSTVRMTPDNERPSWSSATTTAVSSQGV